MTKGFAPMLSARPPNNFSWTSFPFGPEWLMSPKIDGIRVLIHPEGGPVTRSLDPVRNRYIRTALANPLLIGLDGELVLDWTDPKTFNKTQSAVMSFDGEPGFQFCVFDDFEWPSEPYEQRRERMANKVQSAGLPFLVVVPQFRPLDHGDFAQLEQEWVDRGFEGAMLRRATRPYKFGRSTWREGGLIKVKRYADAEGVVIGWKPLRRNFNAPEVNALGLQERSKALDGIVDDDSMIGALTVRVMNGEFAGAVVDVGGGWTELERRQLRAQIELVLRDGWEMTFTYLPHGALRAPRQPIFKRWRNGEGVLNGEGVWVPKGGHLSNGP